MMTARPRTKRVRSRIERTITLPIFGIRYGGSSRIKEEGNPFKMVLESSLETSSVAVIPSRITSVRSRQEAIPLPKEKEAAKNMVIMAIKVGKRPLQGTKLLVRIAMRRSRGDSMIRHPVTPQALQPKPMHIVG